MVRTQPNFRLHIFSAVIVIFFGWLLRISSSEWQIITLTTGLIIVVEAVNTCIESVVDLVSEEYHQKAKVAKDVAAGMVLLCSTLSVVIGLLIFLPKIL